MPAYDRYHQAVRNALIKDGWTITDDPLALSVGKRTLYVDLGAEQILGAEKAARRKRHGKSRWRSRRSSAPRRSLICMKH